MWEWDGKMVTELARGVIRRAIADYLDAPVNNKHHEHAKNRDSAYEFLFSDRPGWRGIRNFWTTLAFADQGKWKHSISDDPLRTHLLEGEMLEKMREEWGVAKARMANRKAA